MFASLHTRLTFSLFFFFFFLFQIGKTSGLVMTLTGILKNIILVVASVVIWMTQITPLQVFGYAIALGGLVYYSVGFSTILDRIGGFMTWIGAVTGTSGSYTLVSETRLAPNTRKLVIMGLGAAVTLMLVVGLYVGRTQ